MGGAGDPSRPEDPLHVRKVADLVPVGEQAEIRSESLERVARSLAQLLFVGRAQRGHGNEQGKPAEGDSIEQLFPFHGMLGAWPRGA